MGHSKGPGVAHQALMTELHGVMDRFGAGGMPLIEQIAVLSQLVGQKISALDAKLYSSGPVLESVMLNIVAGNDQAGTGGAPAVGQAGGLVGFNGHA